MIVYLAGGMRTPWREEVTSKFVESKFYSFINPMKHELLYPDQYTTWDMFGIENSDIIFAYMEEDNPSGVGLALEVGFATARGRMVIFVDETSKEQTRYFGMVRACSDVVVETLEEGITFLEALARMVD